MFGLLNTLSIYILQLCSKSLGCQKQRLSKSRWEADRYSRVFTCTQKCSSRVLGLVCVCVWRTFCSHILTLLWIMCALQKLEKPSVFQYVVFWSLRGSFLGAFKITSSDRKALGTILKSIPVSGDQIALSNIDKRHASFCL